MTRILSHKYTVWLLLLAMAAVLLVLSGCGTQLKFMYGGAPCDATWDHIDYRYYNKYNIGEPSAAPNAGAQAPPQDFGACSDNDLANHSCK